MKVPTLLLLLPALLFDADAAHSQELPLWEIGFGGGLLHLPYYRGSDITHSYGIPFPYLVYRGERFNIDEGGMHGKIFKSDRVKLELSLAGGIPVSSNGSGPRQGMPDLDPTAELGPSLEINLWKKSQARRSLWLKLPLRSTFAVSTSEVSHQGFSFSPYLEYIAESSLPGRWKFGAAFGPLYADEEYHNYFYEVAPLYVTADRPEYHSQGGYSGSRMTFTAQKKIGDVWLGAFYRYDTLSGAVFTDSPLVTTNNYQAIGIAFTWIVSKSHRMVEVAD